MADCGGAGGGPGRVAQGARAGPAWGSVPWGGGGAMRTVLSVGGGFPGRPVLACGPGDWWGWLGCRLAWLAAGQGSGARGGSGVRGGRAGSSSSTLSCIPGGPRASSSSWVRKPFRSGRGRCRAPLAPRRKEIGPGRAGRRPLPAPAPASTHCVFSGRGEAGGVGRGKECPPS